MAGEFVLCYHSCASLTFKVLAKNIRCPTYRAVGTGPPGASRPQLQKGRWGIWDKSCVLTSPLFSFGGIKDFQHVEGGKKAF